MASQIVNATEILLPSLTEINITELCNINMEAFQSTLLIMKLWILMIVVVTLLEFVTSTLALAHKRGKIAGKKVNVTQKWVGINEKVTSISLMVRLIAGLNLLELVISYVGLI